MILKEDTLSYVGRNWNILLLVGIMYFCIIAFALTTPRGFPVPQLEDTFYQFGPAFVAFILLLIIGGYLIYRNYFKPLTLKGDVHHQVIWGISFLIYAITFLGLCLETLAFLFADMSDPILFFIWRTPMIIFVCGIWIGTSQLFTDNRKIIYSFAFFIFFFGEILFFIGLVILKNIELTMFGFLYLEFIPMAFILAYLWYYYGKGSTLSSPKVLALGFFLLGLVYATWSPWHFEDLKYIYYTLFSIYNLALTMILVGFYALPKETLARF